MSDATDQVKVLLVSGFWRSGSTILTRVLGELQDTFAAGGLETIWEHSFIKNGLCGCGHSFRDCDVWSLVAEDAFGGADQIDARWMEDHQPRMRHLPLMLVPGGGRIMEQRLDQYIQTLDQLYRSIARVTGCRVIVDSSKPPPYAWALSRVPSVDLYNVHLVRDPHGVQYSIVRRQHHGDPRFREHSVTRSTLMWDLINVSQELFGRQHPERYRRLRYEDFVQNPIATIEDIKAFIGEPDLGLPTIENGHVLLRTNHTANGSENRSETGSIPFRLDTRWHTEMARRDRSRVTRLTLPLLRHYGYGHAEMSPSGLATSESS